MKLKIVYRISDGGNTKRKLNFSSKTFCLQNFITNFKGDDIIILADNCSKETISTLNSFGATKIIETNLGLSQSFQYCLEYAIANFLPDDYVYFVEDDYLHREKSREILIEGLKTADYVTIYDNPDKYQIGENPYVKDGFERVELSISESSHWKRTNSTTLTFATKVSILKKDIKVFKLFCSANGTWSLGMFSTLGKFPLLPILTMKNNNFLKYAVLKSLIYRLRPKRILVCSIPAQATHCELKYLSPTINWIEEFDPISN